MSLQREDFPLPDTTWAPTREFWHAAARQELRIPRCGGCARWTWYPRERCDQCAGTKFTWERLTGRGSLFSFVEVHHAFLPQYQELTPFLPALVVPEEAPEVRIATRLTHCHRSDLRVDMAVQVDFQPLRFAGIDREVIAPLFRPES